MYGSIDKKVFQRFLLFADLIGVLFFLGLMVVFSERYSLLRWENLNPVLLLLSISVICMYLFGTYSWFIPAFTWAFKRRILAANFCVFSVWTILNFLIKVDVPPLLDSRIIVIPMFLFTVYSYLVRAVLFKRLHSTVKSKLFLVIAPFEMCIHFKEDVERLDLDRNFYYACDIDEESKEILGSRFVCGIDEVPKLLKSKRWSGVITGIGFEELNRLSNLLMDFKFKGGSLYTLSDYYEINWLRLPLYALDKSWFVFSSGFIICHNIFWLRFKRLIDIFASLLILLISFPIFVFFAILIKFESSGPVIFKQTRIGMNRQKFTIYKLRTMVDGAESKEGGLWTFSDDKRITAIGKLVRKLRVDEIPQLFNVFKGDMSLIGPRPEALGLVKLYEKEIPFYNTRHLVKPGITGWAQVMYGYSASIDQSMEKLEFDLYYIKNYSPMLDINILFKTIRIVLGFKGR